jgi:predicted DCC family thiol-disulfide oxidoreductase YuxK
MAISAQGKPGLSAVPPDGNIIPPEGGIILFDGECNLCTPWVAFVIRRDPEVLFKVCAIQSETGRKLYTGLGLNPDEPDTMILLTRAGPRLRSDAVLDIAAGLSGLWSLFAVFRVLPRPLRDWAYDIIARNRYRWFGKRDSCLLPTLEDRTHFLE